MVDKHNPVEIPTHKHPDKTQPLKDPATPDKNNPINPKTDEPLKKPTTN